MKERPLRTVRSFVRRLGRITAAQRHAFDTLWPRYGVDLGKGQLDLDALFGRCAPRLLEIGFGNGEALLHMASQHPDRDFLGIEVHRPGIGRLFQKLHAQQLNNVRVICADALEVLTQHLADASLQQIFLFFPDPWPKKRHHKRRLVQPAFIELLAKKLVPGGHLHMATDWEDYARQMLAVLSQSTLFANLAGAGRFAPRPPERPLTKFEQRGLALGHQVWDLSFEKLDKS